MASARVSGPLDRGALQASIDALLERHESLRARFVTIAGFAQQLIDPPRRYLLEVIGLGDRCTALEVAQFAEEFARTQVNLAVGPLFDAKLLRLSNTDHVLLVGVDHMICDAASCSIIRRDLWRLYDQAARGGEHALPPLRLQFADYVVWQERRHAAWMCEHAAYWRSRLADVPTIRLPRDGVQDRRNCSGAPLQFYFDDERTTLLRQAATRQRTLLPLVALTAYIAAVSRWCGQPDLLVESLSHGRHAIPDLQSMVGFLANRIFLRFEVKPDDALTDLLGRVTHEFYSAYQHQDFGRVPDLIPDSRAQLYFNWLPANWSRAGDREFVGPASESVVEPFHVPFLSGRRDPTSSFQLTALFSEAQDRIDVTIWYTPEDLPVAAMEQFAAYLQSFVAAFVCDPHARVSAVGLNEPGSMSSTSARRTRAPSG